MLLSALRIAWSLIRIPRLAASLFLLPILFSLFLVFGQVMVTAVLLKAIGRDSADVQTHYETRKEADVGRRLLLGEKEITAPPRVCIWEKRTNSSGVLREVPSTAECNPDRLDVALHVENPATFDSQRFETLFNGLVERIHLCEACQPDAVISVTENGSRADAYSAQALILIRLTLHNAETQAKFLAAMRSLDEVRSLIGDVHLHSDGLRDTLNTSRMEASLAISFNVAFLIIISLWLALKAHRRVLEYFSENGALLPMVAATGQREFYSALWILTLARVGIFLVAAVPLTYYGVMSFLSAEDLSQGFHLSPIELCVWIIALGTSLALATVIASVADLKHRHVLFAFAYRYVPLILCLSGSTLWLLSFLFSSELLGIIRNLITALPIVGIAPVLLSPALPPQQIALWVHTILTAILLSWLLRRNARWFGAHLEEL